MRATIALTCFLIAGNLLADETRPEAISVEQAAHAIVDDLVEGWNAGDGEAYAASFSVDATYRVWNGMFSEGRESIAAGHQRIFDTFYKGTTLHMTVERVRPIAADVALIYLRGHLRRGEEVIQQQPGMTDAVPVLVIVRGDDGWLAVHFQNTPLLTPGSPPDSDNDES